MVFKNFGSIAWSIIDLLTLLKPKTIEHLSITISWSISIDLSTYIWSLWFCPPWLEKFMTCCMGESSLKKILEKEYIIFLSISIYWMPMKKGPLFQCLSFVSEVHYILDMTHDWGMGVNISLARCLSQPEQYCYKSIVF